MATYRVDKNGKRTLVRPSTAPAPGRAQRHIDDSGRAVAPPKSTAAGNAAGKPASSTKAKE